MMLLRLVALIAIILCASFVHHAVGSSSKRNTRPTSTKSTSQAAKSLPIKQNFAQSKFSFPTGFFPARAGEVAPKTGILASTSPQSRINGPFVAQSGTVSLSPQPNQGVDVKRSLIQAVATITRNAIPSQFGNWKRLKFSGYFFFLVGGFTFRLGVQNANPSSPAQRMIADLESMKKNQTLGSDDIQDIDTAILSLRRIYNIKAAQSAESIPKGLIDMKEKLSKALSESFSSIMTDIGMPINNIGTGVVVQFRAMGPDIVRITLDVDLEF